VQITQSGCSYSIAPSTLAVGAGGGPGSVAVSAQSGCSWTATSGDSWISISSGASGSGAGTVSFVVAANSGGARSGTLTVAGQRFTVNQAAAPVACSFSVSPSTRNLAASGGTSSVDVTTSSTCSWSASVSESWVRITSGASGTGSGRVEFEVQANGSTTGRFATLTAAGQSVSISQAGAACTYAVNPTSRSFAAAGGSGSIAVTAPGGCAWVAASGAAWIRLTGGTTGSGNGTVSFSVEANNTGQTRSASITIQGMTISISQTP
jgi:Putative binding domain, N-terminal/Viral BACON domain